MSVSFKKPYLVVPRLIEQPSWGGDYILKSKGLDQSDGLVGKRVGQSYEFFGQSRLVVENAEDDLAYEWGSAMSAEAQLVGNFEHTVTLPALIAMNPDAVLGKGIVKKYGTTMPLLIKLNQALGNSWQLHIKPADEKPEVKARVLANPWITAAEAGGYMAKPETWYYFENGKATLGLKPGINPAVYRVCCERIEAEVAKVAAEVKSNKTTYDAAQTHLVEYIAMENPWQYVNVVTIHAGQMVDLSRGGVHHSWEADLQNFPLGNCLYEIQVDRMDAVSTTRSFDQGKLKSDGSFRPISIVEYFANLDSSPQSNDLHQLIQWPKPIRRDADHDPGGVYEIARTPYYVLLLVKLTKHFSTYMPQECRDKFSHVFVRRGPVGVSASDVSLELPEGTSYLMPAEMDGYMFGMTHSTDAEVLIAYLPD